MADFRARESTPSRDGRRFSFLLTVVGIWILPSATLAQGRNENTVHFQNWAFCLGVCIRVLVDATVDAISFAEWGLNHGKLPKNEKSIARWWKPQPITQLQPPELVQEDLYPHMIASNAAIIFSYNFQKESGVWEDRMYANLAPTLWRYRGCFQETPPPRAQVTRNKTV